MLKDPYNPHDEHSDSLTNQADELEAIKAMESDPEYKAWLEERADEVYGDLDNEECPF